MVKCLDNLVTLYRTLIALCGILIAVGISYHLAILGMPTTAEAKALGDKLDFFGLNFPVTGIRNIGSILVVILLVMRPAARPYARRQRCRTVDAECTAERHRVRRKEIRTH